MNRHILLFILLFQMGTGSAVFAESAPSNIAAHLPASALLGEKLSYNVSFLWFDKIARGEIHLQQGPKADTYLATLTAKTRGMAAFFTSNRVETYTTLMEEGPDGLLRPLLQTSDTKKGKDGKETHRLTSYAYDFSDKQVRYSKVINGVSEKSYLIPMEPDKPIYDFLSAFYNLRLGRLGLIESGHDISLSAFSRKGPEEIVISRLMRKEQKRLNFSEDLLLCKVLMTPDTFKTKGRDVYVGFDRQMQPQIAVVKNVIGLGDVRGELVHVVASDYYNKKIKE